MSDLVGNPEDRFSRVAALLVIDVFLTIEASTGVTAPDLSGGGGGGGGNETTDFGDFDEEIDWTSLIETYMKDQEFNR